MVRTVSFRRGGDPPSDARKPTETAILLGQVLTPPDVARRMAELLMANSNGNGTRVLDPCVGPGTFIEAVATVNRDAELVAFDIDRQMVARAKRCAAALGVNASITEDDFVRRDFSEDFELAILNPPYVRQEWLRSKSEYRRHFRSRYSVDVPGASNLYVYFLLKTFELLRPGGRMVAIVYDSWQSTLYGRWLLNILTERGGSITVHPVHRQPFEGHLIDATILLVEKLRGGVATGVLPSELSSPFGHHEAFSPVDRILATRRGLRLKQAAFFLCDISDAERLSATPFVKKLRTRGFSVPDSHSEAALLTASPKAPSAMARELRRRLQTATQSPESFKPVLTWYRERPESWFLHAEAPYAPLLFNYYIRNRPTHVYNRARAFSDNFYGVTPRSNQPISAWLAVLNSTFTCLQLLAAARNQGNGLAKLQLFEYRAARVPNLAALGKSDVRSLSRLGRELINLPNAASADVIRQIDSVLSIALDVPEKLLNSLFRDVATKARGPKL